MKFYIKYFSLGLVGLVLQLAFPFLHIDFLVLVVGFAFLSGGLGIALISAAALALLFSAFTLANPLWIFAPFAVGLISFPFLLKNFSFSGFLNRAWLFFHLWLCQALFGMIYSLVRTHTFGISLRDGIWGMVTVAVGAGVFPFLAEKFFGVFRRFPFLRKSTGELDYFRPRQHAGRKTNVVRKPFGWEEKI